MAACLQRNPVLLVRLTRRPLQHLTRTPTPSAHQMHGAHQPNFPACTQVAVGLSENGCITHGAVCPGWQMRLWLASNRLNASAHRCRIRRDQLL